MSKTKTKPESKAEKKHFLVEVNARCRVLVVNAKNDDEAVAQAERAVNRGDFKLISSYVGDDVKTEELEQFRQEYADVVSDNPDFDWPE